MPPVLVFLFKLFEFKHALFFGIFPLPACNLAFRLACFLLQFDSLLGLGSYTGIPRLLSDSPQHALRILSLAR